MKQIGGRLLHIRPLRRGEDGLVRDLCARLSPTTRYLRFFLPAPVVPDSILSMLADVDDRRRLAFVAELDRSDGGEVVALANLGATDDGSAEVALVVHDEWQRQGIGIALASRLLLAAEARGYHRFVAHMRWDNRVARALLNHVGEVVSADARLGMSEVTFVRRRRDASC